MKVKVRGKLFDSAREPIVLGLDRREKRLIADMPDGADRFPTYPEGRPSALMQEWVRDLPEPEAVPGFPGVKARFALRYLLVFMLGIAVGIALVALIVHGVLTAEVAPVMCREVLFG